MKSVMNRNPWLSIWVKPRETIQGIVETNPRSRFWVLSFIYGLPWLFQAFQTMSFGQSWNLTYLMIIALILAIPVGAISFSLMSLILYWTGKILKGSASYIEVRAACAWTNVPNIVPIICWIALIANFGQTLFTPDFQTQLMSNSDKYLLLFSFVVQLVAGIWGMVIFLQALSQVQGFSIWKAIFNAILLIIVLIVAGYILALIGNWIGYASATQQASS